MEWRRAHNAQIAIAVFGVAAFIAAASSWNDHRGVAWLSIAIFALDVVALATPWGRRRL